VNPILSLFLRLTAVIAVGLVLVVILSHLLVLAVKAAFVAALIAAVVIGCLFIYNHFRRNRYPVGR
jgi:hypothetical protein